MLRLEANIEAVYLVAGGAAYRVNGNYTTFAPAKPMEHRGLAGIKDYPRYVRCGPSLKAKLQRQIERYVAMAVQDGACAVNEAEAFLAEVFQ